MRTIIPRTLRGLRATIHVATFHTDVLIAGPYTGEFGWEVMDWAGYVRRLSTKYQRTIVLSYKGNQCLYAPCEYHYHGLRLEDSGYGYGSVTEVEARRILQNFLTTIGLTAPFDWLHTSHLNRLTRMLIGPQLFSQLAKRVHDYDIAFHFRYLRRADFDRKNYPIEDAFVLVNMCKAEGMRVCCIGHPDHALCPDGCEDFRNSDLEKTKERLEAVRILVGGSSGPMHFASSYGMPIVVWFDRKMAPLADRYLYRWNPHSAPVFFASDTTWQPRPRQVFLQIVKALAEST